MHLMFYYKCKWFTFTIRSLVSTNLVSFSSNNCSKVDVFPALPSRWLCNSLILLECFRDMSWYFLQSSFNWNNEVIQRILLIWWNTNWRNNCLCSSFYHCCYFFPWLVAFENVDTRVWIVSVLMPYIKILFNWWFYNINVRNTIM